MTLRCMDVNQGRTGTSLVARVGRPAFCRWSNPTGVPSELQESGNKKPRTGDLPTEAYLAMVMLGTPLRETSVTVIWKSW